MKKKNKDNVVQFSCYFIKKRILQDGRLYENEVVGECDECLGSGVLPDITPELVCTSCEGAGIIYYGKENINWNLIIGV